MRERKTPATTKRQKAIVDALAASGLKTMMLGTIDAAIGAGVAGNNTLSDDHRKTAHTLLDDYIDATVSSTRAAVLVRDDEGH